MTLAPPWTETPLAQALGWALIHTLWQGAIAALALWAVVSLTRAPRARYAAACLSLLAVLAGFSMTFTYFVEPQPGQTVQGAAAAPIAYDWGKQGLAAGAQQPQGLPAVMSWLTTLWLAGVVVFYSWHAASWMAARRLGRAGVCSPPVLWQERLNELAALVRVSRPVVLLESCLAEVPVVIGHLRPVILVPAGFFTGLTASQLESILLHELAHIRRWDYLVNMLQTAVTGLLFYHPAVWWISSVICAERENCCDDDVVGVKGNARDYAVALVALEQLRSTPPSAALAATGGVLRKRLRRLLPTPAAPRTSLAPLFCAGFLALVSSVVALAVWQPTPAQPALSPDSPYSKWLNEDAAHIISREEASAFRRLRDDQERERFIGQFWLRRDPTPGTPANEFKTEHYRRISYANERFRFGDTPGWQTDRGRTYIQWGPADEVESHPSGGTFSRLLEDGGPRIVKHPFEAWLYRWIEGVGSDVIIEFIDKDRSGRYQRVLLRAR